MLKYPEHFSKLPLSFSVQRQVKRLDHNVCLFHNVHCASLHLTLCALISLIVALLTRLSFPPLFGHVGLVFLPLFKYCQHYSILWSVGATAFPNLKLCVCANVVQRSAFGCLPEVAKQQLPQRGSPFLDMCLVVLDSVKDENKCFSDKEIVLALQKRLTHNLCPKRL